MIDNKKVLAIIPARGGSKGIPRKNVKAISGKPMIQYTIEAAKECEYIDIDFALGRTAAEAYCPCPPAIPAAMPGEILGEREIEALRRYGIFNIKVVK